MATKNPMTWSELLGPEKSKPYFKSILAHINNERAQGKTIYPDKSEHFAAFSQTPFSAVKCVIIGQDPYHGPNQAHGMCFSVKSGTPFPPSLRNIFQELVSDCGLPYPSEGCLTPWAKQGVLLLNTVLSVESGKAHSHAGIGWELFTDHVIATLNEHHRHLVFLLWGSHAQKKAAKVDTERHLILKTVHPSPLSAHRGFFGCKPFSQTNNFLRKTNQSIIQWGAQEGRSIAYNKEGESIDFV